MALHILHNTDRFACCQAVISPQDALLLLDEAAQQLASSALLQGVPCPVFLLQGEAAMPDRLASGVTFISVDEWVNLTLAHAHNLNWS